MHDILWKNNSKFSSSYLASNCNVRKISKLTDPTTKNNIFPYLPVLESIGQHIVRDKPNLSDYFLIAGQHALDTTGSLMEWLLNLLHLPASNIYMVGKSYSTSQRVVDKLSRALQINYQPTSKQIMLGGFADNYDYDVIKLWEQFLSRLEMAIQKNQPIKGIIVLDDGGHLFRRALPQLFNLRTIDQKPIPIVGIEQTSSGIFASNNFAYPIIEVATAAAKQLEAPMLAKLFKQQLEAHIISSLAALNLPSDLSKFRFAIVGLGNIGKAVLSHLLAVGNKNILVFDKDPTIQNKISSSDLVFTKNLAELLEKSDIVLGCTGHNFMEENFAKCLAIIQHPRKIPRIFVSLSSKDIEFNSLLIKVHQDNRNGSIDPLKDIFYPQQAPNVIILSGGMPLNFMQVNSGKSDYSIPHNEIQLTRGLLAAAILQAYRMIQDHSTHIAKQYKLDANWQRFVVQAWMYSINQPMLQNFKDLAWIQAHSGGESYGCSPDMYFMDH